MGWLPVVTRAMARPVVSIWYLVDDSLTAHQIFFYPVPSCPRPGAAVTAHCNDDGDLGSGHGG